MSNKELEGLNNMMAAQRVGQNYQLPPLSPKVQSSNDSTIPIPSSSSGQERLNNSSVKDKHEPNPADDNSNTSATTTTTPNKIDHDPRLDPKRLKRIIASRQYSQKYRLKQLQYIGQLEAEVKALQAEVAIASPRIKYSDRQNALLRAENSLMKQRLSAFSGELLFKEAQYEELKKERDSLKQYSEVYQKQMSEMLRNGPGSYQMLNTMALNQPAVVEGGPNQFLDTINQLNQQNLNQFAPGLQFFSIDNNNTDDDNDNDNLNPDRSYNFM